MFVRVIRNACIALLLGLVAPASVSRADDLAEFHEAILDATDAYNRAMSILEQRSQAETSAAVHQLRARWQDIAGRFAANRPAAFADDPDFSTMFMQIDMSLIGVLLVIDLGNRDSARAGLTVVGETLARLSSRSAAPR
jgi:hypothetical protein